MASGAGTDVAGPSAEASMEVDPYLKAGRAAAEQMIRVAASMAHISPFNYETQQPATGWKFAKLNRGVLIYKRTMPGSASHAFLGKGVVGVPPESVYHTLKSLDVVVKLSEDEHHCCQIVHAFHVTSRCLMKHARDFACVMYNGVTNSNRCFVSATTGAVHPLCPHMDGVVRGHVKASSWFVEPYGEADSMVTFFSHVEFGGRLPTSVVNLVSIGQPMCIYQLGLLMLERKKLTALLQPPRPPLEALALCKPYLTPHEQSEILGYDLVYFAGPYARKRGPTASSLKTAKRVGLDELSVGLLTTSAALGDDAFLDSFDTPDGEYALSVHDHIAFRYEVLGMLSCGVTSQVVKVFDHKTHTTCGIKIIKNKRVFRHIALSEIGHLNAVARGREALTDDTFDVAAALAAAPHPPDAAPADTDIARAVLAVGADSIGGLIRHFEFRGHLCMVFELMSSNLLNVVKVNRYSRNLTMLALQDMAIQVTSALALLHALQIVHCDLKPENILVRNPAATDVKLAGMRNTQMYIQTRYYRAPEIVLGSTFTTAIDVWSLGCVLAEVYTGRPLFPARHESELLLLIRDILGDPPQSVLRAATRRELLVMGVSADDPQLQLRDMRSFAPGRRHRPWLPRPLFVDFLSACLAWDPADRWPALALLSHPWLAPRFRDRFAPHLAPPSVASASAAGDAAGPSATILSPDSAAPPPSSRPISSVTAGSSSTAVSSSMVPLQSTLADVPPSSEHVQELLFRKEDYFTV
ncbi:CMGC/DYRK/DYRK2 protein kinase [Thecamonas trahens ATCC 50062]|uniref:dual-specificity kinase n=1 Tax=Thecamonas trahens ATCC 50062 TaxID=461836 RepID=A0A0L0DTV1_THETB|nr:CMGC/DYRK/DYRK2 protein kinase [Thecamonas trahens ATCC 50062]KNC55627.1 CMGC/DYRK/DYRK2 protein kinase [Thecamonas trahens ATCC 50062]|eukprot:XP_013761399.1 CMGC/DYRK/DYRK2 protein kinase [Thecamonas trahens ATCC 50062]